MTDKIDKNDNKLPETIDAEREKEARKYAGRTFVDDEIIAIRAKNPDDESAGKSNFEKKGAREEGILTIPKFPVHEENEHGEYPHQTKMKEQDFDPTEYPKRSIINDAIIVEADAEDIKKDAGCKPK